MYRSNGIHNSFNTVLNILCFLNLFALHGKLLCGFCFFCWWAFSTDPLLRGISLFFFFAFDSVFALLGGFSGSVPVLSPVLLSASSTATAGSTSPAMSAVEPGARSTLAAPWDAGLDLPRPRPRPFPPLPRPLPFPFFRGSSSSSRYWRSGSSYSPSASFCIWRSASCAWNVWKRTRKPMSIWNKEYELKKDATMALTHTIAKTTK